MADQPGGSGLKKEVAGQPLWLWGLGAVIVIGGYLYFRSQSSGSSASSGSGSGAGQEKSSDDINETIKDFQSSPSSGGQTTTSSEGPERQWLKHKTGSKHPWTYLAKHHESVKVGPHGSRRIVKDK